MKTSIKLTAVFENAEEGGYIGYVEEMPGVNTQGETIDETKANLIDALDLYLDTQRFLGVQNKNSASVIREEIVFT